MRSLKRVPAYKKNGKTNLLHLKNKSGVYHIYDRDKLVYVGHSGYNLYKTITRHFQSWKNDNQRRVTYHNFPLERFTVKVWLTKPNDAQVLEETHILKYRPRDNEMKIKVATDRQRERVQKRFKKAIPIKQKEAQDWEKFSYAASGELLDENGNILF